MSTKRKRDNMNFDFDTVYPKLHELMRSVPSTVAKELSHLQNLIPKVVVWGAQSSGKSSVLKRLFNCEFFNQTIRQGLGTLCPLEINSGPMYSAQKIYVKSTDTGAIHSTYATVDEAHGFIQNYRHGAHVIDYYIYIEIPGSKTMIVTDLPGHFSSTNVKVAEYFEGLKMRYLQCEQTIILHVVRADVDPATDFSTRFLNNIHNKIIPVLTHMDHGFYEQYVLRHVNNAGYWSIAALLNNVVTEVSTEYKIDCEKQLVYSHKELLNVIFEMLKTQSSAGDISDSLMSAREFITKELEHIGYSPPDLRELVGEFRLYLSSLVQKEFEMSGTELAVSSNTHKSEKISFVELSKCMDVFPTCQVLASEMKSGNRNALVGSEGWSDMIKKYSEAIIEKLKTKIDVEFIDVHSQILTASASKMFDRVYKPATAQAQQNIKSEIPAVVEMHRADFKKTVQKYLDAIARHQYSADDSYLEKYNMEINRVAIEATLEYLSKQTNKASAVDTAMSHKNAFVAIVASSIKMDSYELKARFASEQLSSFWKSKLKEIHNFMYIQTTEFETMVKMSIVKEIQKIGHNDLLEPGDVQAKREMLLNIHSQIRDILEE